MVSKPLGIQGGLLKGMAERKTIIKSCHFLIFKNNLTMPVLF